MPLRIASALLLASVVLSAQAPLPRAHNEPALLLGAAWYPEQWPESTWESDLSLMEQAHVRFVRITEFAWSSMEPSEGNYDFTWVDHAIRAAERHHIYVVLGTPSAAPPAWLTTKYPETLRTLIDGSKDQHGRRQQFDFSSPKYRQLAGNIAEKMAIRYGHDKNVIGWQIDNEYARTSYGADTKKQFQDWLKAKFKTLDNLNKQWTTSYWSESFDSWSEIPIYETGGNPGLMLAWKQFVSDTWRSYQKVQLDAIRAHAGKDQPITTNMMGWFDAYDHYTVSQDLDFASWDSYVGTGHLDPSTRGAIHDLTRGFLMKNFWVMETQPASVNWSPNNNLLDKGEVRAMAWNAIGHGSEAVEYWQWRSALNGQEQYHGTLVGPDGKPVPLYAEVQQLGAEMLKVAPLLDGTTVQSQVAILHDYDSRWAINWQRHNKAFDPIKALTDYYTPLHAATGAVDVVKDTTPLSKYKLVVAPALNVLTEAAAKNLIAYVRGGGHLVLTPRSAMKDDYNSLYTQRQPGPLANILGAHVEQYYALERDIPVNGSFGSFQSDLWADQLTIDKPRHPASPQIFPIPPNAGEVETLATYGPSNGWLDNQPAAVTRKVGKGRITYIGATLNEAALTKATAWMLQNAGVSVAWPGLPSGIDLSIRSGNNKTIYLLTNYNKGDVTMTLPSTMTDALTGKSSTTITLPRFGVAVLTR